MQKKRITRKNGKYFELCLNDGSEQVSESHNDPQWKNSEFNLPKWLHASLIWTAAAHTKQRNSNSKKKKRIQQRDAQVLLGRFVQYHKMYCYRVECSVYYIVDSFTHRRSNLWFRIFLVQFGFSFGANVNIFMCVVGTNRGIRLQHTISSTVGSRFAHLAR